MAVLIGAPAQPSRLCEGVVRSAPWIATSSSVKRAASLAKAHGCSVAEVYAVLAAHPIELDRDKFLQRTLALELAKLDEAFIGTAMGGEVAAGSLLVKIYERRATLLGLNPPQGHAVETIHEPVGAQTSTDQMRAAIDRIRGIAPPKPDEPDDSNKLN